VKSAKRQFDPQAFLAKVGAGKTILKYRRGRIIYAQGKRLTGFFTSNWARSR
jgi:CRP/FNR family transcriptional regulator, cyclic AMP receptor protein